MVCAFVTSPKKHEIWCLIQWSQRKDSKEVKGDWFRPSVWQTLLQMLWLFNVVIFTTWKRSDFLLRVKYCFFLSSGSWFTRWLFILMNGNVGFQKFSNICRALLCFIMPLILSTEIKCFPGNSLSIVRFPSDHRSNLTSFWEENNVIFQMKATILPFNSDTCGFFPCNLLSF